MPSLIEIGQVVLENIFKFRQSLERKIFKFRQCIFAISLSCPRFTQGCFATSLNAISPVVLEGKIFKNWSKCFWCVEIISPWKRVGPSYVQLKYPSPKNALCHVWLKLIKWSWKRRILNVVNLFCYFVQVSISPWKKGVALNLNKLNPLYPMMLFAKLGWNWPWVSGEEDENVKSTLKLIAKVSLKNHKKTRQNFKLLLIGVRI